MKVLISKSVMSVLIVITYKMWSMLKTLKIAMIVTTYMHVPTVVIASYVAISIEKNTAS